MDQAQLVNYYQKAKALLTPIQWEEPFGLTTVEAMACGTPVISLHRGAAPEIIENGKNGFVVHSLSEMVVAVSKIDQIKRQNCRDRIEEVFSYERMIDRYEKAFSTLLLVKQESEVLRPADIIKVQIKKVQQKIIKIIK